MGENRIYVDYAYDLENRENKRVPGGFVELVGYYGTDLKPAEVARISYKQADKTRVRDDLRLVEYLWANKHTSPFEFIELEFVIRMPIFVARQLFRHRTASVNEMSMRYSKALSLAWAPDAFRVQDTLNKQGSVGLNESNDKLQSTYFDSVYQSYQSYKSMLDMGAPKEQARAVLPVSMLTEVRWKQDFKNLSHLLALRIDSHAQLETRKYAVAMYMLIERNFPMLAEVFDRHTLSSYSLTHEDIMLIVDAAAKGDDSIIVDNVKSKSRRYKLLSLLHSGGVEHPNIGELRKLKEELIEFNRNLGEE